MLLKRLFKYTALLTGNFEKIFRDINIPSLPEVVTRIMTKLRDPEASAREIAALIECDPGLTSQVLKITNSPFIGLAQEVTDLTQAVQVLGMKEIEAIVVSYGVSQVVQPPSLSGFDLRVFWTDSLFRALFARELASERGLEAEKAFLIVMLQDIALPVLLTSWFDVYQRVYRTWKTKGGRLCAWEKELLSWDHAQAGAWIAKKWKLPDLLICGIGLHTAPPSTIAKLKLHQSVISITSLSADIPSILAEEPDLVGLLERFSAYDITPEEMIRAARRAEEVFLETASAFSLRVKKTPGLSLLLEKALDHSSP
jgi:HD-like signal output (HDOD) protein